MRSCIGKSSAPDPESSRHDVTTLDLTDDTTTDRIERSAGPDQSGVVKFRGLSLNIKPAGGGAGKGNSRLSVGAEQNPDSDGILPGCNGPVVSRRLTVAWHRFPTSPTRQRGCSPGTLARASG